MQYANLKTHIKSHIGHNKKYDAIPVEKLPQKLHTCSNTTDLMASIKKGSSIYRKVISREHPPADISNPTKWNKRLNTIEVTRKHVKNGAIDLSFDLRMSNTPKHFEIFQ